MNANKYFELQEEPDKIEMIGNPMSRNSNRDFGTRDSNYSSAVPEPFSKAGTLTAWAQNLKTPLTEDKIQLA